VYDWFNESEVQRAPLCPRGMPVIVGAPGGGLKPWAWWAVMRKPKPGRRERGSEAHTTSQVTRTVKDPPVEARHRCYRDDRITHAQLVPRSDRTIIDQAVDHSVGSITLFEKLAAILSALGDNLLNVLPIWSPFLRTMYDQDLKLWLSCTVPWVGCTPL
jgi:hypothetical protein